MAKAGFIPLKYKPWIEARRKFNLSHVQIQMARELGLNPKKFGSLANRKQEIWKLPLPEYIEKLYFKRHNGKNSSDVRSIEKVIKDKMQRKVERKAASQSIEIK